jgi:hypothetical protein
VGSWLLLVVAGDEGDKLLLLLLLAAAVGDEAWSERALPLDSTNIQSKVFRITVWECIGCIIGTSSALHYCTVSEHSMHCTAIICKCVVCDAVMQLGCFCLGGAIQPSPLFDSY